jgi:hypothetical protein
MQHHDTLIGKFLICLTAMSLYVTMSNVQPYLTAIASVVSIIAGCFAIRYYIKKSK